MIINAAVAQKSEVRQGVFGVEKIKNDYYLHIDDTLFGRPFLAVTRFATTPVDLGFFGGELIDNKILYFEKHDKVVFLRALIAKSLSNSDTADISLAVGASGENPILAAFKTDSLPSAKNSSPSSCRIKFTDFIREDNQITGFAAAAKAKFGVSTLKNDLSYIESVNTYPTNLEIVTVKTYTSKGEAAKAAAAKQTGMMTFKINTSLVLLPSEPMKRRFYDERVGYFTDDYKEYSDNQQKVRKRMVVSRWRLEPKDSLDFEKMRRGELVEPKKQIVYYIDPATPKQWRKYLIQGVEDWNPAFEQAGWKNAITAKEWPEDDSTMSLEDARFSVIRYLASPTANAYGPRICDPRTGEIIESHIGWYHNVMQIIHDWYMVQVGAVDERARKMNFDEDLIGQLIRFVSSHEIGHTLGLKHNMGASFATKADSLRNKSWVEKYGHTASIMDYARFNYAAQPGDNIGPRGIFPRVNDYDKWAIEWGYRYFADSENEENESLKLSRLTDQRLKNNPRLWYGGEGNDNDPRAQTEDLGDNQMKTARWGIENLKFVVENLADWTANDLNSKEDLLQVYNSALKQYKKYVGHALRNVGGVYVNKQSATVYTPESKSRCVEALNFLKETVFDCPSWLISQPYVSSLDRNPDNFIRPIAENAVATLTSLNVFSTIYLYSDSTDTYDMLDYIDDLIELTFSNTRQPSKWQMYIQRQMVTKLVKTMKLSADGDLHPFYRLTLNKIHRKIHHAGKSEVSKSHFLDLVDIITTSTKKGSEQEVKGKKLE